MAIELRYFEDLLNAQLNTAVDAQLLAGITPVDVAWPGKTFTPTKGKPYLKPELAARVRTPVGFGADSVQEWNGTYQVGIFIPRDTGTRLMNELASTVLRTFPRGLAMQTPDGVWMTVTRGTAPVPVPFNDWINLPVQIDWFATEPPSGQESMSEPGIDSRIILHTPLVSTDP